MEEYFKLFHTTFDAIKEVDGRFRVGGPAARPALEAPDGVFQAGAPVQLSASGGGHGDGLPV